MATAEKVQSPESRVEGKKMQTTKTQASSLKPQAVTADPATWPKLEDHPPYKEAVDRLEELRQEKPELEAKVTRLEARLAELDAAIARGADVTQEASRLTSHPAAESSRSGKPSVEDVKKAHAKATEELTRTTERLPVILRAIELQKEIVAEESEAAAAKINSALAAERSRRVNAVLGLIHHLWTAIDSCETMAVLLKEQDCGFPSLSSVDAGQLMGELNKWQHGLCRSGYIPHDADEKLAEAAELEKQIPDLNAELIELDQKRVRDQIAAGNADQGQAQLAIANRAEKDRQAVHTRHGEMHQQVKVLRSEAAEMMETALSQHIEKCVEDVQVNSSR